jgi:hypothetical protein
VAHVASGVGGMVQVACSARTQQSAAGCLGCVVLFHTGDIHMTYHTAKHIVKVQQVPNDRLACCKKSSQTHKGSVLDSVVGPVIDFRVHVSLSNRGCGRSKSGNR